MQVLWQASCVVGEVDEAFDQAFRFGVLDAGRRCRRGPARARNMHVVKEPCAAQRAPTLRACSDGASVVQAEQRQDVRQAGHVVSVAFDQAAQVGVLDTSCWYGRQASRRQHQLTRTEAQAQHLQMLQTRALIIKLWGV